MIWILVLAACISVNDNSRKIKFQTKLAFMKRMFMFPNLNVQCYVQIMLKFQFIVCIDYNKLKGHCLRSYFSITSKSRRSPEEFWRFSKITRRIWKVTKYFWKSPNDFQRLPKITRRLPAWFLKITNWKFAEDGPKIFIRRTAKIFKKFFIGPNTLSHSMPL